MNSATLDIAITTLVFVVGSFPLAAVLWRGRSLRAAIVMIAILSVACGTAAWTWARMKPPRILEKDVIRRPAEIFADGYVSSDACRSCHAQQYESWHHSYHRTMTQVADRNSILGDFAALESYAGIRTVRDQYGIEILLPNEDSTGPEGSIYTDRRRIVMTTGSHHYQAYWFETGQHRKTQVLPFVYLLDDKRWIPRNSAFLSPPNATTHSGIGSWNNTCIQCHATRGRPELADPLRSAQSVSMNTQVTEFGIACESCHGPGGGHVESKQNPVTRYRERLAGSDDPTIIQPEKLTHERSAEVCGQCHSVTIPRDYEHYVDWTRDGQAFRPGQDLRDSNHIVRYANTDDPPVARLLKQQPTFLEDRFWSDGMIRIAGREFNGLLETPCYQEGDMSCLSCHVLHKKTNDPRSYGEWADDQLGYQMDGNTACLQCHKEYGANPTAHTHHAAGSTGSLCYNCHMPYTTQGLLKAIRSHQIDSPSVTVTLATGRPNACNQCHLDKSLGWTAEWLESWYDLPAPPLSDDQQELPASVLDLLTGDAGQRALSAWTFGWAPARQVSGSDWLAPFLAHLLSDPYDVVRYMAYRSLITLPEIDAHSYDFVGDAHTRRTIGAQVYHQWVGRRHRRPIPKELRSLFMNDGKLDLESFSRLANQRDDSRVYRAE